MPESRTTTRERYVLGACLEIGFQVRLVHDVKVKVEFLDESEGYHAHILLSDLMDAIHYGQSDPLRPGIVDIARFILRYSRSDSGELSLDPVRWKRFLTVVRDRRAKENSVTEGWTEEDVRRFVFGGEFPVKVMPDEVGS